MRIPYKDVLKKIQNLPESQRKIILWSTVVIVGAGLFFWWIQNVKQSLKNIETNKIKEGLGLPQFQEELKKMPEIKMPETTTPEIPEEELKKLEEIIKETSKDIDDKQAPAI